MYKVLMVLIMASMESFLLAEPVEVIPPQNKILASENGRYVFGQISSFRSDQYLLDTANGRLWQLVEDKNKNKLMQPVPIVQLFGEEAYLPEPIDRDIAYQSMLRAKTAENIKKNDNGKSE